MTVLKDLFFLCFVFLLHDKAFTTICQRMASMAYCTYESIQRSFLTLEILYSNNLPTLTQVHFNHLLTGVIRIEMYHMFDCSLQNVLFNRM